MRSVTLVEKMKSMLTNAKAFCAISWEGAYKELT